MALARNPTENLVQRRLNQAYIQAEPVELTLIRRPLERVKGSLVKGDPTPLEPQTCRLIPFKRRLTEITRDKPEGDIINLQYVLMGQHDMDIEVSDEFEYDGGHYEVKSIEPNRSFRIAANIVYLGKQVDDKWSG